MNDQAANLECSRTEVENRLRRAGIPSVFITGQLSLSGRHFAFLVSEDDVARGRSVTRNIPGVSVNFFTLTGAKSGGFRLDNPRHNAITLAIFPLEIADYLLERSSQLAGLDARDQFGVAAYIKTYFGGGARIFGLPADTGKAPDLHALARAARVDPSVCNDRLALEEYLAASGWRPPIDMLERLGLADSWIKGALLPNLFEDIAAPPGLTVFFLRARGVELGRADRMRTAIEDSGFEILKSLPLQGALATLVRRSVRGGNWGAGPWPLNGGPPVHLLFAVDVFPIEPDDTTRAQHPFLDNRRILAGKTAARNAVLNGIPSSSHFNALHSADNSAETLRFAATVLDDNDFAALNSTFLSRIAEVDELVENTTPLDGANTVALTVRPGNGAEGIVRKIYRHQYLGNLDCGAELLDLLAPEWPELPRVRKRGNNYLEIEDVGAEYVPLSSLRDLAPLPIVLRIREILRAAATAGFDPVGWDPGQGILISPANGDFKILGFDRLQRRPKQVLLGNSICLTGPAQGQKDGYALRWYPVLGIPRAVFVSGGHVTMQLYRIVIHPLRRGIAHIATAVETLKTNLRRPVRTVRRMIPKPRWRLRNSGG